MSPSNQPQPPAPVRSFWQNSVARLLRIPFASWMLGVFCVVFFAYYVVPVFLNDYHELRVYPDFPVINPIGGDLREYLGFSKALLEDGSPYIPPNYYPPLQALLFAPFVRFGPDQSYVYITVLNFLSFLAITWLYPWLVSRPRRWSQMATLGLVSGLFSYGLLFQLERGQFDLLVMVLCYAAIYLFHHHPRLRLLAYLLFVVSVNIKIYPLVFILCFTLNWRDWKHNLLRWGLLGLANLAGLIVLGWNVFQDFIRALMGQLGNPSYAWVGNHSIDSFVRTVAQRASEDLNILDGNIRVFSLLLIAVFALFLVAAWALIYRKRISAANPYLLILLTLATMLIPSTSHDYKLSILVAPVVLLFNHLELRSTGRKRLDVAALLLALWFSASYFSTLLYHPDLPIPIANNLPALMNMAFATTGLAYARVAQARWSGSPTNFLDLT